MVQFYDHIPDFLAAWIRQQKLFWVATAPLSEEGHVNLSPKGGYGTFHIVDAHTVWYEDLTGSGVETISHLRENSRITVLFNAFEGPPRIARLFGKGVVYEFDTPEYNALIPQNERKLGSRSVIMITVHKVASSCGYAVPFFDYRAERTRLDEFNSKNEGVDNAASATSEFPEGGLKWYWKVNNTKSIDGLPGIQTAYQSSKRFAEYGTPVRSPSSNVGPSKTTEPRTVLTSALTAGLAFGVGVLLSTQVYHALERFGNLVLPQ